MPCPFYAHERTPVRTEQEAMQDPGLVWMVVEKRISLASMKIQTRTAQSAGGWLRHPVTNKKVLNSSPIFYYKFVYVSYCVCQSQWPRGLRHRSTAARLLRLWVRIPLGAWMSVRCECCVLSGRGLCDELITRPEESYRLWYVVVCDLETSWMRRPWATGDCRAKTNKKGRPTWATVRNFKFSA